MKTDTIAVMFADLAGYTERTSAQSHQQNAAMLKRLGEVVHPLVRSFEGRVVKEIGDAVLGVFETPTRAVEAAMAIQDKLAQVNARRAPADRLRLRIAVNVGEVRLERGDVFGEAVNIAARIESQTPPDAIWISESTALTMNRAGITLNPLGALQLKGVNEPVSLYAIPRAPAVTERGSRPDTLPYSGRQLAALRARWRRRRLRIAAAAAVVVLGAGLGAFVVEQRALRHERLASLGTAIGAGDFARAAEAVVALRQSGAAEEAETALASVLTSLSETRLAGPACQGIGRLTDVDPATGAELDRLRLRHAFALIESGELAQARACIEDVRFPDSSTERRVLELEHLHLRALDAVNAHEGGALNEALHAYQDFLRAGAAPAEHMPLIATVTAEAYAFREARPIADSLVVEFLHEAAAPMLADRILDPKTSSVARAWLLARLESEASESWTSWKPIYAAILERGRDASCAMRNAAVDGLRRLQRLDAVGLIAREAARNDSCTHSTARAAMDELIAVGRFEPHEEPEAVVVARR